MSTEDTLAFHLRSSGIEYEQQFRHTTDRRWRWDFRVGDLLVDIQGGIWAQGKHTRGAGYQNDCDKANDAVLSGWRVLRVTSDDVFKGRALEWIEQARR